MELLISTLTDVSKHNANVIVMGDFNARHPMWFNTDSNKLGDQLSSYLTTADYTIANSNMYTHKNSIIDLTLIKGCKDLVSNWSAHPEIMVNTDHTMIMFDLSLSKNQTKKPRWNIKKADWDKWRTETRTTFETMKNNISNHEKPDINNFLLFRSTNK